MPVERWSVSARSSLTYALLSVAVALLILVTSVVRGWSLWEWFGLALWLFGAVVNLATWRARRLREEVTAYKT